jgi:hypothetical protein
MARTPNRIDRFFADERRVEAALRQAARRAILEHRRAGRPIVIRRNGQLVTIRGEEIDRVLAQIDAEAGQTSLPAP